MNNAEFSVTACCRLDRIRPGGRIHVTGVCGVAMAQMALLLDGLGYAVSGSDREFYEPMGGLLRASRVKIFEGYDAANITGDLDLVVIGNVVTADHPEALAVRKRGLPYTIFPVLLHDLLISGHHSIVVSGTHGKTTTSAMCAFVLKNLGLKPSYFAGGAALDLPSGLEQGSGPYSVVEGDEYDSAFFAKLPKFHFYNPDSLIVTSIEFDHADIYPSLKEINKEFHKLVLGMRKGGRVVCCIDDANVAEQLKLWSKSAVCEFITYGIAAEALYRIVSSVPQGLGQTMKLGTPEGREVTVQLAVPGLLNARNAASVFIVLNKLGLAEQGILAALSRFRGVKRRQQVLVNRADVTLIEDFAHHPTAVRETIVSLRAAFKGRRLIAVFEPRSNTSRRKVFFSEYVRALCGADRVLLGEVQSRPGDDPAMLLDVKELASETTRAGTPARSFASADRIAETLLGELAHGDVIVLMSNGSFGGLAARLSAALEKARQV